VNGDSGGFNLVYDGMNRLLSAKDAGAYWDEELAYDRNGNISNLKRWRKAASQELVDNLTYTYANGGNSNQLLSVSDVTGIDVGYNNRNTSGNDFTYDDNGNITKDSDKGLSEIGYNVLNLVSQIKKAGVMTQSYVWDGAGTKLKYFGGGLINKVYIGGVEYTKNTNNAVTPSRLETEEGFVGLRENWTESSLLTKYVYYYTLKDHLGNIRIVMNDDQDAELVQSNSYSAFGLLALGPNAGALKYNSRFYNGKEKQEDTGWLDYGARMYIPESGRWLTIDPLAEKWNSYSPYSYALNNGLRYIDPDGRDVYNINSSTGEIDVTKTKNKRHSFYVSDGDGNRTYVGSFKYNSKGLVKLPSSLHFNDGQGNSVGFDVKKGNGSKAYVSGNAFASLTRFSCSRRS